MIDGIPMESALVAQCFEVFSHFTVNRFKAKWKFLDFLRVSNGTTSNREVRETWVQTSSSFSFHRVVWHHGNLIIMTSKARSIFNRHNIVPELPFSLQFHCSKVYRRNPSRVHPKRFESKTLPPLYYAIVLRRGWLKALRRDTSLSTSQLKENTFHPLEFVFRESSRSATTLMFFRIAFRFHTLAMNYAAFPCVARGLHKEWDVVLGSSSLVYRFPHDSLLLDFFTFKTFWAQRRGSLNRACVRSFKSQKVGLETCFESWRTKKPKKSLKKFMKHLFGFIISSKAY